VAALASIYITSRICRPGLQNCGVHEAEILRQRRIDHRAGGLRLLDNAIDIRAAVGRDADQYLASRPCVGDGLGREPQYLWCVSNIT
jgi:hypothetical protein